MGLDIVRIGFWDSRVSKESGRDLVRERSGLKVYEASVSSVFKIFLFIGQGLLCFHYFSRQNLT